MSNEEFARRFGLESGDFFVTASSPCPYLSGKRERKVFSYLDGPGASSTNALLTRRGFRRSQNIIYLPACESCSACVPVRVVVDDFKITKSRKRNLAKNADLSRRQAAPRATGEQFSVLRAYLDDRHGDGGMSEMTVLDYAAMVEETAVDTMIIEYRSPVLDYDGAEDSKLIGAALTDRLTDGLSMVYSFFEPEEKTRSLGRFMIQDHVALAREMGLPYVYLGYWVEGSPKMDYKADFQPLERLTATGWVRMDRTS